MLKALIPVEYFMHVHGLTFLAFKYFKETAIFNFKIIKICIYVYIMQRRYVDHLFSAFVKTLQKSF